jgi:hypothetical protein
MISVFKKLTTNDYHDRGKLNREVKVQNHDIILALKTKQKRRRALQRQLLHNSLRLVIINPGIRRRWLQKKHTNIGAI